MAGSGSVKMACLSSRKNSRGIGSREEDGEERLWLEEVLMGSPLSLAHAAEHMQGICAERKQVRKPGPIPSLFLSFQIWRNPGDWRKRRRQEDERKPLEGRVKYTTPITQRA